MIQKKIERERERERKPKNTMVGNERNGGIYIRVVVCI
jgi:hypothetical protein